MSDQDNLIYNKDCHMFIKNGVFYGIYKKDTIIDLSVALKVFKDREKLCNNNAYPAIWDCRNIKYWTKDARIFKSTDQNTRLMTAVAVIYPQAMQQLFS